MNSPLPAALRPSPAADTTRAVTGTVAVRPDAGTDGPAPGPSRPAADEPDTIGRPIGVVMARFPDPADGFVSTEIRGLQARGHRVVPIALAAPPADDRANTEPLAAVARHLDDASDLQALTLLAMGAGNVPAAIRFCRRQTALPWRALLWRGARLAALADNADIEHLQARGTGEEAALAIVAALLLGCTASVRIATEADIAEARDLGHKLASGHFVVATERALAAAAGALAPQARVVTLSEIVDVQDFQVSAVPPHPADRRILVLGPALAAGVAEAILEAVAALPEGRRPGLTFACAGQDGAALAKAAEARGIASLVRIEPAPPSGAIADRMQGHSAVVAALDVGQAEDAAAASMIVPIPIKVGLAAGLAVVALDAPNASVAADLGCARSVGPGDQSGLLDAIDAIARMSAGELASLGHGARRRATQLFSLRAQMRPISETIELVAPSAS
ncbi:MAG: hypothetical protein IT557_14600 [Alphaproteobacteria bacterium]|nr:hypothetical protein [Alphaproteobacteria bacterium]